MHEPQDTRKMTATQEAARKGNGQFAAACIRGSIFSMVVLGLVSAVACSGETTSPPQTGGTSGSSSGGVVGSGGGLGSGGQTGTGGATSMGGRSGSGGDNGTGGFIGSGGLPASGGAVASGGSVGTGGMTAAGGMTGTGGKPGSGGGSGNGGSLGGGGAGTGTGGSTGGGGNTGTGGGAAVPSAGCGKTPTLNNSPSTANQNTLTVSGTSRQFVVRWPTNYDNTHPYRLILDFHGATGSDTEEAPSYFGLFALSNNTTIFAAALHRRNLECHGGPDLRGCAPQGGRGRSMHRHLAGRVGGVQPGRGHGGDACLLASGGLPRRGWPLSRGLGRSHDLPTDPLPRVARLG